MKREQPRLTHAAEFITEVADSSRVAIMSIDLITQAQPLRLYVDSIEAAATFLCVMLP